MSSRILTVIGTVTCLLLSLLAAFFVTFNMVFSDIFGFWERVESYLFAGGVFLVLGFFSGLAGPRGVRRWTGILAVPSIVILVLYTFTEFQNALIHLGFALLIPAAAHAGARAGAMARAAKR